MRRLFMILGALLLTAGSLGVSAQAQSTSGNNPSSTSNPSNDPILCGLFVGASLDVSNAFKCLSGDSSSTSSSSGNTSQTAPAPSSNNRGTSSGTYAALGDSVAAGLGLPMSPNATAQDQQCGRSPLAYPNVVSAATGLKLTNLACSGATAGDLFTQQHVNGPNPAAQLNGAFAQGTPQLITITAGANDAHWADFIRSCYAHDCTSAADQLAAKALLTSLALKLQVLFPNIEARSSGAPPQTILTGYYNPISPSCATLQSQITPNEIAFLTNETAQLNQILQTAASESSFVTFVPVSFSGHDICSSNPWVQGLNDPAPFHPTAQGQQMIANDILAALRQ